MDLNTLNMDPDPGFWPNLDFDQEPGPINFERKNKKNFREKLFSLKSLFFKSFQNKMLPKEIFTQLSL